MVKISGKYNKPGGLNFIPGATYVGDSRVLGVSIFLEHGNSTNLLLNFNEKKPVKVNYLEFARSIDFLEAFSRGTADSYESPHSTALKISVVMLESNRILLRWQNSSVLLLPLEFFEALNVLTAIKKKAIVMVRRRIERQALLDQHSLIGTLKNWGGLGIFLFLLAMNLLFLLSLVLFPEFIMHWLALTIFLMLWLIVGRPEWSDKIVPVIVDYLNDDLLNDLANIHFPKRSTEVFLIILLLIFFYLVFGGEALNFVTNFYQHSKIP